MKPIKAWAVTIGGDLVGCELHEVDIKQFPTFTKRADALWWKKAHCGPPVKAYVIRVTISPTNARKGGE